MIPATDASCATCSLPQAVVAEVQVLQLVVADESRAKVLSTPVRQTVSGQVEAHQGAVLLQHTANGPGAEIPQVVVR